MVSTPAASKDGRAIVRQGESNATVRRQLFKPPEELPQKIQRASRQRTVAAPEWV